MPTVTYTHWKRTVAQFIEAETGLSPDDIPLISFPTLFDEGLTAAEAAAQAIANIDNVAAYAPFTCDLDDDPFALDLAC